MVMNTIRGQVKETIMIDTAAEFNYKDVEYPVVNVDEVEYCKLNVHYEADPEKVQEKINEAISSLRNVKMPGFRKGKAPDSAIKMRMRPQINQYLAREMASEAIDDVVFETGIKLLGQPIFQNVLINGNKFSCDVEMVKKPDLTVDNIKFDVPKPPVEDVESLVEKSLLNLRIRVGEINPYEDDDFVEMGDQVTFSFSATIDGQEFDGSTVEGEMYQIGSDRWVGWDDNLLGMKADETKEFEFTFSNGPEIIVGKTAKFSVTIHMGTKRKPHPINEEFYKIMGVTDIEVLMSKLRSIAKASVDRREAEAIRNQVGIKLVENNKFDVPEFLIENEARAGAAQMGINLNDTTENEKKIFTEQAERNLRLSLILDTIRENEPDSVLNETEARQKLANHIQLRGQDPNELFNNPAMSTQLFFLLKAIKEEFTLQWVAKQANIVE
jgi:trigger factor